MDDQTQPHDGQLLARRRPIRRAAPRLVVAVALVSSLISAAVCAVAILTPAPAPAVPLIVAICVGTPIFAGWEVPFAVATLRDDRANRAARRAIASLRRTLRKLPETEHPLGF